MSHFKTIEYYENGILATLSLNRPEKRNALNSVMIADLISVFRSLNSNDKVKIIHIVAKGKSFCAGADLAWLMHLKESSEDDIIKEFSELGLMLKLLYNLKQITIASVHGAVYGGGNGLLAACDYVISAPDTVFSFSEIKLGLIPATISPFIIERIGKSKAKRLFLTGESFYENHALSIGLVDEVSIPVTSRNITSPIKNETFINLLLSQPEHALTELKVLFKHTDSGTVSKENHEAAAGLIARLIKTSETQNLLNSFLKK